MSENVRKFVREPAFQLGRFKKTLHADFNNEFSDDLAAVLAREQLTGRLADFRAKLGKARNDSEEDSGPVYGSAGNEGFQIQRFQRNLTADLTEGFAGELLGYLNTQETLSKYIYAFRQKLDNRLNDNFQPGIPYQERKAV